MSLIHIECNPSSRQLRQFGAIAAVAFPMLGWLLTRRGGTVATWLWGPAGNDAAHLAVIGTLAIVGLTVTALAFAYPRAVRPLFVGLSLLTAPIGLIISELVMLSVYFAVITPIALAMRLTGRDALRRRLDRSAASYWQATPSNTDPTSYYRQF